MCLLCVNDRPDSVFNLFKENGFEETQITKLVRAVPRLLISDPKNTILPKIEFFRSKEISSSDLCRIVTSSPDLLHRSLKNHLIPGYDFLKSLLVENDKVIRTFERSQWSFLNNVTNTMVPNIALLREVGASQSTISFLVTNSSYVASIKSSRFVKAVQEVKEMGFDPSKIAFAKAIVVVLTSNKPMWEYKLEIFRRWGWSKEDTLFAFKRNPNFMLFSEEKIMKVMNFLVNNSGRPSTDIAKNPVVLLLSLEKRIIPRCSVVQILIARDLVKNGLGFSAFLLINEKSFLEKYVIKFQDVVPQLLSVYQNKMDILDVEIQSE
ncbi:transcription termination factor MTERF4, chloroplastic-like [Fagus crenata]